jgi:hypothetical protein
MIAAVPQHIAESLRLSGEKVLPLYPEATPRDLEAQPPKVI